LRCALFGIGYFDLVVLRPLLNFYPDLVAVFDYLGIRRDSAPAGGIAQVPIGRKNDWPIFVLPRHIPAALYCELVVQVQHTALLPPQLPGLYLWGRPGCIVSRLFRSILPGDVWESSLLLAQAEAKF